METLYTINDETLIDNLGVCHKDFSLRDEIEYNFRRAKEKEMQQNLIEQRFDDNDYLGRIEAKKRVENRQNYDGDLSLEVKYPKNR